MSNVFCQMLKLWDLDGISEEKIDMMENVIELENMYFMEPLLLKGLHRYFPPNREIFWDVKLKNWDFGKKPKNQKTETGTPFATEL